MDSITRLVAALAKSPTDPGLYYDLGGEYLAKHLFEEAITAYQDALRLAPNHPQILLQLGNTYTACGQFTQAALFFKRCIQADKQHAGAHFNLGNVLRELAKPQEAAQSYRNALAINPNDAESHNNLGNVLRDMGQLDEAIASYQRALSLDPNLYHALAHLIHQKQHICNWNNLTNEINLLRDIVKQKPNSKIAPFAFLSMPNTSADEQLICANHWATQTFSALLPVRQRLNFNHQRPRNPKIKVGYLSADFRLHPLAFLITDVFKHHDRHQFEIYAYAYGLSDDTETRQQLMDSVDHFITINGMSNIEAAQRIYDDHIDILVDLTGYTKNSRTAIVALKPTPISINWLGYPGTMGKVGDESLFDYIIVDNTIASTSSTFSESLLTLPCYQPNNHQRPIGLAGSKADHQIPESAFVFCCFNQTFKITADIFSAWMHILTQVPNSVLWLLECNSWAKQNLLAYAQQAGIASSRIVFAPRVSIENHLARHVHADLFLDTLPYNAHTTASDALWMNVPIVTYIGDTFSGRVCASLLNTVGLSSLITQSMQDYTSLAIELATHPEKLAQLKQNLTSHKQQLFNPSAFVSTLETAYQSIYQSTK